MLSDSLLAFELSLVVFPVVGIIGHNAPTRSEHVLHPARFQNVHKQDIAGMHDIMV